MSFNHGQMKVKQHCFFFFYLVVLSGSPRTSFLVFSLTMRTLLIFLLARGWAVFLLSHWHSLLNYFLTFFTIDSTYSHTKFYMTWRFFPQIFKCDLNIIIAIIRTFLHEAETLCIPCKCNNGHIVMANFMYQTDWTTKPQVFG